MNAATLASKRVRQETMEEETTVEIQEEEPLVIDAETPPDPIQYREIISTEDGSPMPDYDPTYDFDSQDKAKQINPYMRPIDDSWQAKER